MAEIQRKFRFTAEFIRFFLLRIKITKNNKKITLKSEQLKAKKYEKWRKFVDKNSNVIFGISEKKILRRLYVLQTERTKIFDKTKNPKQQKSVKFQKPKKYEKKSHKENSRYNYKILKRQIRA